MKHWGHITALTILPLLAVGCAKEQPPSAREVARETVSAVVKPIVAKQFPGVPTDIVVECVMENASDQEIVQIANSALLGTATDSLYAVSPILQRPQTLLCVGGGLNWPTETL